MAQKLSEKARKHKNEYNSEYGKANQWGAQKKYFEKTKENRKQQTFFLFLPQDQDILDWLNSQSNKSGYIKDLIRKDIRRSDGQE